ncbi:hypothetical protein LMF32_05505 [Desemzia sp. C1]|uniref:Uncharacterized protein n=1 Tax=Desemzia incerta TaxID=82801 RepID=A0A1I5XEQ6_9LACT|nr:MULTISPECIES: hypothetical protein [Desemzia]MCI3028555.1 hypothetical protein [Desemzia sp. C1]SFQ30445.1 hypothetical protein SAMN04488506_1399 [Desemzia incerta]
MFDKYKEFTEKHPYKHVILLMTTSSFIGILIEYVVNKDFIGTALYGTIGLTLIELFRTKRNKRR